MTSQKSKELKEGRKQEEKYQTKLILTWIGGVLCFPIARSLDGCD